MPFTSIKASEHKLFEIPGTRVLPIEDTRAGRQYELYIKLPESYSKNSDVKYPVIYFTDAMWHFEILSASTAYLMEDVILVGISWQKDIEESLMKEVGKHVSRFRDYSISKSSNPETQAKHKLGQAENHLAFIRNDVIKYIESNYRTDPSKRTYFGYSLGSLFGAYTLLTQPDTFKNYILGSPVITQSLVTLESNTAQKRKDLNANVFVSVGELEKDSIEHIEGFASNLRKRNYPNLSVQYVVIESGDHGTAFPATGVRSVDWLSKLQQGKDK